MKTLVQAAAFTTLIATGAAMAAPAAISGININGQLGYSKMSDGGTDSAYVKSTNSIAYGLAGGYDYALNQNFTIGGELGYQSWGKFEGQGGASDVTENSLNVLLTAKYFDVSGMNAFVKLGEGRVTAKPSTGDSKNAWKMVSSLGAGYNFQPNLDAYIEWSHLYGETDVSSSSNDQTVLASDVVFLGLAYTIPMNKSLNTWSSPAKTSSVAPKTIQTQQTA